MFLLDTNVVSETYRPLPSHGVIAWIAATPREHQYISAVTLTEIIRGATRHPDAVQRARLEAWIAGSLQEWLDQGVLPVSESIARSAGRIAGNRDRSGRPISFPDALIAATAIEYRLTLVTRNVADFEALSLHILNPWTDTVPRKI